MCILVMQRPGVMLNNFLSNKAPFIEKNIPLAAGRRKGSFEGGIARSSMSWMISGRVIVN